MRVNGQWGEGAEHENENPKLEKNRQEGETVSVFSSENWGEPDSGKAGWGKSMHVSPVGHYPDGLLSSKNRKKPNSSV